MIKRERHLWTLFLLAAGLLTGCGSDDAKDNPNPVQPSESKQEIQLLATGKPFTRATTIDNDTELQSQDLKISAYHHGKETAYLSDATLHYDTDAWKFWSDDAETHYYWPTEGSIIGGVLDFVGYCPYTQPAYISSLSYTYSGGITFTADMTQTHDTEFLYAYLPTQTYTTQTGEGGALPLQFQHPFAKIYFTLSDASGEAVTINSISISGTDIATNGTYTHSTSSTGWSSVSGSGTLSGMSLNTPYIVIPNNYSSKTLTVNATWSEWGNNVIADVSTTITPTWVAGTSYTYTLTLTKYALKVDEEKYTEQW